MNFFLESNFSKNISRVKAGALRLQAASACKPCQPSPAIQAASSSIKTVEI
jgi:hypothetical protein